MAITLNSGFSASNLYQAQSNSNQASERLSSGQRINSAADDAAGLAISNRLQSQIQQYSRSIGNANDQISLLQTADGSLGSITDNLQRLRELAAQASSGILNSQDRSAIDAEAQQLITEVQRILGDSSFNGQPLFSRSSSGSNSSASAPDSPLPESTAALSQSDSAKALGSLSLSSAEQAQAAFALVDSFQAQVSEQSALIGAQQNRLNSSISQLYQSRVDSSAANSRITDTDYAQASSRKAQQDILLQAGIAVQVQANMRGELVLQLLNGARS